MQESLDDPMLALFETPALQLFRERRFVVHHGPIERFPDWMHQGPLTDIEQLCRSYRGKLEIAQGGDGRAPSAEAGSFLGTGGQTPVAGTNAQALLRLGLTVFFCQLTDTVPAGKSFLRRLEEALGVPPCASLSAFANAPGSGLPFHHDAFDQLLIQVQGQKKFTRALCPATAHPRISVSPSGPTSPYFEAVYHNGFFGNEAEVVAEGTETVTLQPGSCLFLPAGTWHRTVEQEEPCLSLAVAVRAPSGLDLIENALRYFAGQSADFRAPVYGLSWASSAEASLVEGSSFPSSTDLLDGLVERLAERLPQLDAASLRRSWWARQQKDGDATSYRRGQGTTRFVRLPGSTFRISPVEEGNVRLSVRTAQSIDDAVLQFHSAACPLVEAVAQTRAAFEVNDLVARFPDFEQEEIADFMDQLASVGLLRPLPVPIF